MTLNLDYNFIVILRLLTIIKVYYQTINEYQFCTLLHSIPFLYSQQTSLMEMIISPWGGILKMSLMWVLNSLGQRTVPCRTLYGKFYRSSSNFIDCVLFYKDFFKILKILSLNPIFSKLFNSSFDRITEQHIIVL